MTDYISPPASLPPGSNVWAYLRDSGGTEQEQSVSQQRQEIESFCREYGLVLERVFADVGKSAKSTKGRDQFSAMIDTITAADHPAGLLVWSLSRFARNIDDATYFKAHLRRHNVVIHSLTEKIPDGLAGRIVESVQDYSNADYIEQQSRHIKRALEINVRNGYAAGGTPPRGYIAEKVIFGKKRDGSPRAASRWIPDPELFPLVKLAWKLRAEGKPYAEISKATGGKIYRSHACWSTFFANRSYLGVGKCGGVEIPDHHEAAVSLEDWLKVQMLREDATGRLRGLSHPRRLGYPSLLSGLAYCAKCGAAIFHHIGTSKRPRSHYYICGRRDRERGLKSCGNPKIKGEECDTQILNAVLLRILTPDYAEQLLEDLQDLLSNSAALTEQIEQKRHELRYAGRAIENLLDLAEAFGPGAAQDRLKQRETERAVLERELRNLEASAEASHVEVTPEALALALQVWHEDLSCAKQNSNTQAARSMLARFVSRIDLDGEHIEPEGLTKRGEPRKRPRTRHHARIWYTFAIDVLSPDSAVPVQGRHWSCWVPKTGREAATRF